MTSWNDPASSLDDSLFPGGDLPQRDGWSKQQLSFMESEWRRLQVSFAYHPSVRVTALPGSPPDQFEVEYRMRTVSFDEAGQLQYVSSAKVHIWLSLAFPHEPPLVRPIGAMFHPNVSPEGIAIGQAWTSARSSLVEVVTLVGRLLAFQAFDPNAVYNREALEWWQANPQIFPTDTVADFVVSAGGEPLERIGRQGPATLDRVRAQLKRLCDALLAEGAPTVADTRTICRKMRVALDLFLSDAIPESLRRPAGELDDFVRELDVTAPTWDALRPHRLAADAALAVAQQMKETHESLTQALRSVELLGHYEPSVTPAQLIRQLPPTPRLQLHQGNVVNLIARAGDLLNEAKALTVRLGALRPVTLGPCGPAMRRRLEGELARANERAEKGKSRLAAGVEMLQPLRNAASGVAAALHRAADWREYADFADRGNQLVSRVLEWGAEGVQSLFIENETGRLGPIELEQQLTVGALGIAARNPASTIIEILRADTGLVLGRGEMGSVVLSLPARSGERPLRTTFQLTGNADELAVQLDYLVRESTSMLEKLASPVRGPATWLGKSIDALNRDAAREVIQREHAERVGRWKALCDDLSALAPFKHRLATFRLLQRMGELARRLNERMASARHNLADSTRRIARIVAISNTDIETGRLHVPGKHAEEYTQQLHRRDLARQEIAELEKAIQSAAREIRARVDSLELRGSSDRPALSMLGKAPPAWANLEKQVSDAAIRQRLTELEHTLETRLMPRDWTPSKEHRDIEEKL